MSNEHPHSTRPRRTRSRTIAPKKLTRAELAGVARTSAALEGHERPRERADCELDDRPCPWVSCKHHLYLDVNPETGSIKLNFPDLEPWELEESCALDVASRGGVTLEGVGEILNLTRERVRQVEVRALVKTRIAAVADEELGKDDIGRGGDRHEVIEVFDLVDD